jgi:hypothetical protein
MPRAGKRLFSTISSETHARGSSTAAPFFAFCRPLTESDGHPGRRQECHPDRRSPWRPAADHSGTRAVSSTWSILAPVWGNPAVRLRRREYRSSSLGAKFHLVLLSLFETEFGEGFKSLLIEGIGDAGGHVQIVLSFFAIFFRR